MFFKNIFHKAIAAIDNYPTDGSEQGKLKTFQKGVTILDAIKNIDSLRPFGLYSPWNSPGQNTGVGSRCLLQGIFPTQGWNPGPHITGGFFTSWATREALWFIGRGQNIYINRSLEEVGSNPRGWLGRVQDFHGGSHCRCGGNSKRTRMRSGVPSHFSHAWLFVTPWTIACQAPLSMGFSRQEDWSGLPCPPPGGLPDPEIGP